MAFQWVVYKWELARSRDILKNTFPASGILVLQVKHSGVVGSKCRNQNEPPALEVSRGCRLDSHSYSAACGVLAYRKTACGAQ